MKFKPQHNQTFITDNGDTSVYLVNQPQSKSNFNPAPTLKNEYIGLNAYISPNYLVSINAFSNSNKTRSLAQIVNELNLKDNRTLGIVSVKSQRLIKKSVNWLCQSAMPKRVYNKRKNTHFEFKVGFITLTIPAQSKPISGHWFNKHLLSPWLTLMRNTENLCNYVWKVELQKNKSIHVHVSVDCFIHYKRIRKSWNALLKKNGLLDEYRAKYHGCTFREYARLVPPSMRKNLLKLRKSYRYGVETDWTDPNSTDVHSVQSVEDLAAYISKYMAKENELSINWRGRIWGCSQPISQANKASFYIPAHTEAEHLKPWLKKEIEFIPILGKPNVFGTQKRCGEVFLFKPEYWDSCKDSPIYWRYREIILFLQRAYSDTNYEYTIN